MSLREFGRTILGWMAQKKILAAVVILVAVVVLLAVGVALPPWLESLGYLVPALLGLASDPPQRYATARTSEEPGAGGGGGVRYLLLVLALPLALGAGLQVSAVSCAGAEVRPDDVADVIDTGGEVLSASCDSVLRVLAAVGVDTSEPTVYEWIERGCEAGVGIAALVTAYLRSPAVSAGVAPYALPVAPRLRASRRLTLAAPPLVEGCARLGPEAPAWCAPLARRSAAGLDTVLEMSGEMALD